MNYRAQADRRLRATRYRSWKQRLGFDASIEFAIGVRDPQLSKYRSFQALHRGGVGLSFMVITKQMKHAVDDQMAEVIAKQHDPLFHFASHRLESEYNIAEQHRSAGYDGRTRLPGGKREHICRSIVPAISAIELPLVGVVGQHDPEFYMSGRREPDRCYSVDQRSRCSIPNDVFKVRTNRFPSIMARSDIDRRGKL